MGMSDAFEDIWAEDTWGNLAQRIIDKNNIVAAKNFIAHNLGKDELIKLEKAV